MVLIRKLGVDRDLAEDALQESFVRLATKIQEGQHQDIAEPVNERALYRYILRTSVNYCRDLWKKQRVKDRAAAVILQVLPLGSDLQKEIVDHEEHKVWQRRAKQLQKALRQLEEPYSSLFRMLVEGEMSLAEIAAARGIKLDTIYVQHSRGIRKLKNILKKEED